MSLLKTLLAERSWLLADGATGTNLFARGLAHGNAPEMWNVEAPDKVRAHYRGFIEAGCDIVLTNTFGGTANRLKLHGAQNRVYELNRAAAELLVQEIAAADRPVVCAGSVGPTGDLFQPIGPLSHEDGVAAFVDQMRGLKDGGDEIAWIETMSSTEEFSAALEAAETVGLPAVCTLSFDTNGRTMMGVTPTEFAQAMHARTIRPVAFGGNCGTGAADLLAGVLSMRETIAPDDVIVTKANCGIPEFVDGAIRYNGTPELMADYAILARDAGARIIGGCCGTEPEHIVAMRAALEAHTKGAAPTLAQVVGKLGQLTGKTADILGAAGDAKTDTGGRAGRRRRRA